MAQETNLQKDLKFQVNLTYPRDDEYDYYTILERIDLDKECQKDLSNWHGLLIKEPQPINKALKSDDSIFSSKFGRSLQDPNPYSNRYSCHCGYVQGAFKAVPEDLNFRCPMCQTEVKLVGDDFTYFGWITLGKYFVIHPLMYESLASLIGRDNLEAIIEPDIELDSDGNPMSSYDKRLFKKKNSRRFKRKTSLDDTYAGIGILGFKEKFREIIDYFYRKKPNKKDVYDDIVENESIIFTHSIPVYTTQLRIAKVENKRFTFEKTNADFNLLAKLAAIVKKDERVVHNSYKAKNKLLWDMQCKIGSLTTEIIATLAGKKGVIRSTIAGRVAFSSRSVIAPTRNDMDSITLPYFGLVILLEQVLVNIIQKSYNITYSQAYKIWYYASLKMDPRVKEIIDNLIKAKKIRTLINRNPTIGYESMVYQNVIECTDGFTMGINTFILKGLNGDFDGDTLNILLLYNDEFANACEEIYKPSNAFCISRNDGMMNKNINIFKDTAINLNSFIDLGRDSYSEAQLNKIKNLQNKYTQMIK